VQRRQGLIGLGIALLIAAGLAGCDNSASNLLSTAGGPQEVQIKETDMVKGDANAPITFVEYASMTCPHCAAFHADVVPQLERDYISTGKMKFVFREYPLDGGARMASAVARCMKGDAYFNFIAHLFRNQQEWIKDFDNNQQLTKEDLDEGLAQMGRVAGMSREQVMTCSTDAANLAIIDANWNEGQTVLNVQATPTFFINGKKHQAGMAYEELKQILDGELPN
jgi:protein-disulfide isomerase